MTNVSSVAVTTDTTNKSCHDDTARVRQASAFWAAGNFEQCIDRLHDIALSGHTTDSIFLLARALLRVHRIAEAESWLRMMESRHTTEDAIATHAMLLGNASARLDHLDRATALFLKARSFDPHPTIVAETAYYHALALWQARDFRTARLVLQPALAANQDIVSARALQLLGFIAIAEGKFEDAHLHFEHALAAVGRCNAKDVHLEATLLHQLAIGIAEIQPRDLARLDELAHALAWTPSLVMEHVQTLRHIGIAYARTGQPKLALARFVDASRVAPDSPWAIIAITEAAALCQSLNEPAAASGHVYHACAIANDYQQWNDVQNEARTALLALATVVARTGDGPKAQHYLDLYRGADQRLPALSVLHLDLRLQTLEQHAEGVVRGATNAADAISILTSVANAWRRLKYHHRADEARRDLRALTHCSYDIAQEVFCIESSPTITSSSVNATISIAGPQQSGKITLTARQDDILRQLIAGKCVADIAEAYSLEPKTVRNHLSRLYTLFDVRGQSQLVATVLGDTALQRFFVVPHATPSSPIPTRDKRPSQQSA